MTPDNLPFINSLKRESDGYANALTIAGLGFTAVVLVWIAAAHLGWVGGPSEGFKATARFVILGWLIFYGIAALIDYTIYAVLRALTEWLHVATGEVSKILFADPAPETQAPGTPDQREPNVAYLHDLIKRSDQATDIESPLNPNPAA